MTALLGSATTGSVAQAIDPGKSAKAAAFNDTKFIAASIADNEDVMFLSQKAIERGADQRVKELAQQLSEDHSGMLFSMQQLETAGTGSSKQNTVHTEENRKQTAEINVKLANVSGSDFDTVWVSSLLLMHQVKYDELTQAKETVRNPQLKMAITEAIPVIRKDLGQLRILQKDLVKMEVQKKKLAAKQLKAKKTQE